MSAVPRETEPCLYERLLSWAAWATDRQELPDRRDELAGDFRMTDRVKDRIAVIRRGDLTPELQAIERAVADLRFETTDLEPHLYLLQYFLQWKSIETIAIDRGESEFHVTEYLQRALRIVGKRLASA